MTRAALTAVLLSPPLFSLALLAAAVATGSFFQILCALCLLELCLLRRWAGFALQKAAEPRPQRCRWAGPCLILAGIGLETAAVGAFLLPAQPALLPGCFAVGCAGLALAALVGGLPAAYHSRAGTGYFIWYLTLACLLTASAALVGAILPLTSPAEAPQLICLSCGVFGGGVLLCAACVLLQSLFCRGSLPQNLRAAQTALRSKAWVFPRASLLKDVVLVLGKAALGLVNGSVFMFANALYSAGLGLARASALGMNSQSGRLRPRSFCCVGAAILATSLCYMLYSLRLFFGGSTTAYPMSLALIIALYTFLEFGFNLRDALRLRRQHDPQAEALKLINLASTLVCFVLTQTAIMSFAHEGDSSRACGLSGLFFGGLAALVGVYALLRGAAWKRRLHPGAGQAQGGRSG